MEESRIDLDDFGSSFGIVYGCGIEPGVSDWIKDSVMNMDTLFWLLGYPNLWLGRCLSNLGKLGVAGNIRTSILGISCTIVCE